MKGWNGCRADPGAGAEGWPEWKCTAEMRTARVPLGGFCRTEWALQVGHQRPFRQPKLVDYKEEWCD